MNNALRTIETLPDAETAEAKYGAGFVVAAIARDFIERGLTHKEAMRIVSKQALLMGLDMGLTLAQSEQLAKTIGLDVWRAVYSAGRTLHDAGVGA